METENFEDQLKRKLQEREISPSAKSWEKLSVNLDASQEKKRPFVFWMGIAATIIGGILILSLVFNNSTSSDSPEIVDVPQDEVNMKKDPEETSEEIFTEIKKEEIQVVTSEAKEPTQSPIKKSKTATEIHIQQMNRESLTAINNKDLLKQRTLKSGLLLTKDKILDLKLSDALMSVIANVDNEGTVTDAEVNELLAEAAAKISQERYKTDFAVGKVNPKDLLLDVEFEMDNSFRDKIFEILKEGYSKARTAVANRNY